MRRGSGRINPDGVRDYDLIIPKAAEAWVVERLGDARARADAAAQAWRADLVARGIDRAREHPDHPDNLARRGAAAVGGEGARRSGGGSVGEGSADVWRRCQRRARPRRQALRLLMRALLQRVSRADVRVDGETVGAIGRGLVVLLGVAPRDDAATADALARRVVELRIHEDADGRTNLALADVGGCGARSEPVHAVRGHPPGASARLHGSRGAGPGGGAALRPVLRRDSRAWACPVERGRFGASMEVELVNDGPFTIWLDTADR